MVVEAPGQAARRVLTARVHREPGGGGEEHMGRPGEGRHGALDDQGEQQGHLLATAPAPGRGRPCRRA